MNKLIEFTKSHDVLTRPATLTELTEAEKTLNMTFSAEYKQWLLNFGVFSYLSYEFFGLGVKETSWLNILRSTPELRQENSNFPASAVPLMDAGDGQFYLYDNDIGAILVWSSLAGVLEEISDSLEGFILKQLSSEL